MSQKTERAKHLDFHVQSAMQTPRVNVTIQGSVLEYKVKIPNSQVPGSKRGTIKELSPGARRRMLKHFHKINFTDHPPPLFMTLTYPDPVAVPDLDTRNLHRQHMARHLERITGKRVPAAWRVEWQDRKSGERVGEVCPHWHWLIFGHEFIAWEAVRSAWQKTIKYQDYVRTDIRAIDKISAIQMYMAKYISKEAVSPSLVMAAYDTRIGKQYGWLRRDDIPMHTEHVHKRITDDQRATLMSLADEQMPWLDGGLERSFTLYGDVAGDAQRILSGEAIDE